MDSPIMNIETVKDIVAWLNDFRNDPVTFTFHGGEPLLAGANFYEQALPMLSEELEHLRPTSPCKPTFGSSRRS